jgi:transcriptional regulator with XRE-family HTH domain
MALLKQQRVGKQVRRLRTKNGISQRRLASLTGFSPSFISQVEAGLGVTLGEFFAATAEADGGLIVRAGEPATLESWWSNAETEALTRMRATDGLEAALVTLKRGGRSGKHPYPHPRDQFAFVMEGQVNFDARPGGPRAQRRRCRDAAVQGAAPLAEPGGGARTDPGRGRSAGRSLPAAPAVPCVIGRPTLTRACA